VSPDLAGLGHHLYRIDILEAARQLVAAATAFAGVVLEVGGP
jgi:hypothetical protein